MDDRTPEQVAADYPPRRPDPAEADNSEHARLTRACAILRSASGDDDGFGRGACARLLAAIGEARRRDAPVDEDVLATAMAISAHVLELGPRA